MAECAEWLDDDDTDTRELLDAVDPPLDSSSVLLCKREFMISHNIPLYILSRKHEKRVFPLCYDYSRK